MNKIIRFNKAAVLTLLTIIASCSEKSDTTPAPASGKLMGTVQVWDDKTNLLTDNSGVTVTVDDVANTSTVTDATGKYSFDNLSYGLHDLTISKSGYGAYKIFGASHTSAVNATVLPAIQFGKLSTTSITSLTLTSKMYNGAEGVSFTYSVAPTPTAANRGYVRHFLSTNKDVSNVNYMYASDIRSLLNNNTIGGFTKEELAVMGFTSGQTVYIKAYGESVQSNTYTDPNVGIRVFPNSNPNSVAAISFVMP